MNEWNGILMISQTTYPFSSQESRAGADPGFGVGGSQNWIWRGFPCVPRERQPPKWAQNWGNCPAGAGDRAPWRLVLHAGNAGLNIKSKRNYP